MKLLILSDSHGEQEFMQLAVRRERPDAVIHLGDHCADADRLAEEFCGLPVLSVRGNCDLWGPPRAETLLRTFEGVRIFGTHGHRYGVKQGRRSSRRRSRCSAIPTFPIAGRRAASGC